MSLSRRKTRRRDSPKIGGLRGSALLVVATAMTAAGVAASCQLVVPLEAHGHDASLIDGAPSAEAGVFDPCGVVVPRARAGPALAENTFRFAMRVLDLGPRITFDGGAAPAFDVEAALCPNPALDIDGIDSRCPAATTNEVCKRPTSPACDDEGGRDNAFVGVVTTIRGADPKSFSLSGDIEGGRSTLLVDVLGYNGAPDDEQVQVAFFTAVGASAPPAWEGNDVWLIDPDSVLATGTGESPRRLAKNAWVTNDILVAELDVVDVPVIVDARKVLLPLSGGIFTALITREGDSVRLERGRLASRLSVADAITRTAAIDGGACEGASGYGVIRDLLCNAADVPSSPARTAQESCDAVSVAFGFVAFPIAAHVVAQDAGKRGFPCKAMDGGPYVDSCEPR